MSSSISLPLAPGSGPLIMNESEFYMQNNTVEVLAHEKQEKILNDLQENKELFC